MESEEVIEFHPDRTDWPPGAWDDEPDRKDFTHAGFACFIQRNRLGSWCGYVGVPSDHPYYEQSYDTPQVQVHGGLTFAARCSGHLCHVPPPGYPADVWWFGWDAGHAWDIMPEMLATELKFGLPPLGAEHSSYKDMNYAIGETQKLAEQLAE